MAWAGLAAIVLAACATAPQTAVQSEVPVNGQAILWLDRVTWGANDTSAQELSAVGREAYLDAQLHWHDEAMPTTVQATIAGLSVSRQSLETARARLRSATQIR